MLLLLLLVGAVSPGCAPAPSPPAMEAKAESQGSRETGARSSPGPLCLHLEPSRPMAMLGEPVLLIVGLENCSPEPVEVRQLLASEAGLLSVRAVSPGGEEVAYRPAIYRDSRGARSIELQPGELYLEDVPIYYAQNGWFLDRAGRWTFRAQYSSESGLLETSSGELTLEAPRDEEGQRAARTFMSDEIARSYLLGGKGGETLAELAERFPSSPWGRFAKLGAAQTGPSQTELDPALFAELPDAAIAAAAARDLSRRGHPVDRSGLREALASKEHAPLVAEWIRQCLEEQADG